MTDDAPRPGWPAARPAWGPVPEAAPPTTQPVPGPQPATPAWPTTPSASAAPTAGTATAEPPWYRRPIELKLVVAVLIGLVSVTGAVMTWRSAQLGEQATDQDRLALAETVLVRRNSSDNALILQDARRLAASHVASLSAAATLEQQASAFGDDADGQAAARAARDEAEELRAVAQGILDSFDAGVALGDYITPENTLDERSLRNDLEDLSESEAQVEPEITARIGNERREASERYDLWRIPLALAVVLLTLAQVFRLRPLKLGLVGVASVVWIVASVLAFSGR